MIGRYTNLKFQTEIIRVLMAGINVLVGHCVHLVCLCKQTIFLLFVG